MKSLSFFVSILAVFLLAACTEGSPVDSGNSGSAAVKILQTGQTVSYVTGDDGDLRPGEPWAVPRFTVNSTDGTITDNSTGLIWETAPTLTVRTWSEALTYCAGSLVGGYDDWRLPNIRELESLSSASSDYATQSAWLTAAGFLNIQAAEYWSSTTYPGDSGIAYAFEWGYSTSLKGSYPETKTISRYVIAVRGTSSVLPRTGQTTSAVSGDDGDLQAGLSWPDPRFTDNGDNTITDSLTGLVWEKSPSTTGYMTYSQSAAYVASLWTGGKNDWRIPTIRELQSLTCLDELNWVTWLNTLGFSALDYIGAYYWSSTANPRTTGNCFCISPTSGGWSMADVDRTSSGQYLFVWAVRGGTTE